MHNERFLFSKKIVAGPEKANCLSGLTVVSLTGLSSFHRGMIACRIYMSSLFCKSRRECYLYVIDVTAYHAR